MPADLIQGPYLTFTVSFASSTGTDTSFTVERALAATGPWTTIQADVPLLAERAVFVDNTAPIGVNLYYRFTGEQSGVVLPGGPYVLPANGHTWIKDPARPWADLRFDTCPTTGPVNGCTDPSPAYVWGGLSGLGQADDAGLFEILNSDVPADVWGRRKSTTGTLVFFTRTLDATERVYDLFTAGGPLQLQLPDIYGWADAFIQPGELSWEYGSRDQRKPLRRYEVPFRVVGRPLGPIQGVDCANWCEVEAAFPTFGDMAASGSTWLELAAGNVLCPGGGAADSLTDTFSRTVPAGAWGTADTGQPWTVGVQGPAADFSVNGSAGLQTHAVLGAFHAATIPWTDADASIRVTFSLNAAPAGTGGADVHVMGRVMDIVNFYSARVFISPSNQSLMLSIRKTVAGVDTSIVQVNPGYTYVAGAQYTVRLSIQGSNLMAKVWPVTAPEPAAWQLTTTDTDLAGPGAVSLRTLARTGLTNPLPVVFSFDNLWVGP